MDLIEVALHDDAWELTWSDTEERLRGRLSPVPPRAGQPLHVSLDVGSFEGVPFTGPLVLTLREAGSIQGESVTVKRGAHHWEATFTPQSSGPHLLDVGFRTTHTKALHAELDVSPSPVSRMVGWGALAVGVLALLGYTVRGILRAERGPPSPPASPTEPPSAPAAEAPASPPSAPTPGPPSPAADADAAAPEQIQAPTEPPASREP